MRTKPEIERDMYRWLVQHGCPTIELAEKLLICQGSPYFIGLAMEVMQVTQLNGLEE